MKKYARKRSADIVSLSALYIYKERRKLKT